MVFFVAVPFVVGFINFIMPLQIGARDVAFPVMNQISLGLTVSAGVMLMVSLVVGKFSTGGWSAYPPYTGAAFFQSRPRPGLLDLGDRRLRARHHTERHQLRHDALQVPRAGHDVFSHAHVLLDRALFIDSDDFRHAAAQRGGPVVFTFSPMTSAAT
jgi:hypothetical protein